MAPLYREKGSTNRDGYRPRTLSDMAYKIWVVPRTRRLTEYLGFLTIAAQTAYKETKSTIDSLAEITREIQKGRKNEQLFLSGPSEAVDKEDSTALYTNLHSQSALPKKSGPDAAGRNLTEGAGEAWRGARQRKRSSPA